MAAEPPEAPASSDRRCMRSTSKIAGFTVSPSSAMTPTSAYTPAPTPAITSAQVAPRIVSGTAISTSSGIVSDSNEIASTA